MQKKRASGGPAYPVGGADNALRLIGMLRDLGGLRLTNIASELGVAPSTAHRLLAVLVHRGFAVQHDDHRYFPGPSMQATPGDFRTNRALTTIARPHLESLAADSGETASLAIRVGAHTRILSSSEGGRPDCVPDQRGTVLPIDLSACGVALLASMSRSERDQAFRASPDSATGLPVEPHAPHHPERDLRTVRAQGYAVSYEDVGIGGCTIAVPISDGDASPFVALCISLPVSRSAGAIGTSIIDVLLAHGHAFEKQLRAAPWTG